MRVMVITNCTGDKAVKCNKQLTLCDFRRGKAYVAQREQTLAHLMRPASEMYTGKQHIRLMWGIRECASSPNPNIRIDLRILSAGYGLIPGSRSIAPYEATFKGMKSRDLCQWAGDLCVPADFRQVVATQYDLGFLLLGYEYIQACRFDNTVRFGGKTIAFCGSSIANRIPPLTNLRVVPLPHSGSKNLWLKGELGARLLKCLTDRCARNVKLFAS